MVIKTYTECDWCKKIILHKEQYIIIYYKIKGQIPKSKPSETVCNKCLNTIKIKKNEVKRK